MDLQTQSAQQQDDALAQTQEARQIGRKDACSSGRKTRCMDAVLDASCMAVMQGASFGSKALSPNGQVADLVGPHQRMARGPLFLVARERQPCCTTWLGIDGADERLMPLRCRGPEEGGLRCAMLIPSSLASRLACLSMPGSVCPAPSGPQQPRRDALMLLVLLGSSWWA